MQALSNLAPFLSVAGPTLSLALLVFLLCKAGLTAATRPKTTRTESWRSVTITITLALFLVATFVLVDWLHPP